MGVPRRYGRGRREVSTARLAARVSPHMNGVAASPHSHLRLASRSAGSCDSGGGFNRRAVQPALDESLSSGEAGGVDHRKQMCLLHACLRAHLATAEVSPACVFAGLLRASCARAGKCACGRAGSQPRSCGGCDLPPALRLEATVRGGRPLPVAGVIAEWRRWECGSRAVAGRVAFSVWVAARPKPMKRGRGLASARDERVSFSSHMGPVGPSAGVAHRSLKRLHCLPGRLLANQRSALRAWLNSAMGAFPLA